MQKCCDCTRKVLTEPTRVCNKCNEQKTLDHFYRDKGRRDEHKRHPVCKTCLKEHTKMVQEIRKTAPPKPPVCECCGRDPNTDKRLRGWAMDHDHDHKCFRGWVCQTCNIGLGHFGDSVEGLQRGIDYLKRTSFNGE